MGGRNRSHRRRRLLASTLLGLCVGLALVSILGSDVAKAGPFPTAVRGYVWDSVGRIVEDADVTVNIRYPATYDIRSTLTDVTDSNGYYSVLFGPGAWDVGDVIEVVATWGAGQEDNVTTASAYPVHYVNVTFPFEIPQFGSMLGFAVAGGAIGVVAVVSIVFFKKRAK